MKGDGRRAGSPPAGFFLAAALLTLIAALPAAAQRSHATARPSVADSRLPTARSAQQSFSDTAEVVAVEVPVQVVLDGQPVRGLTKESFEVYDGRKEVEISSFEVLDLYAPEAQQKAAEIPVASRRHFLVLFDLANSEPRSIFKAREAASRLVRESLHPADLVAVASYTASKGPRLALGFTSDRRQIEQAIGTLGMPELMDRSPDPLQLVASDFQGRNPGQGTAPAGRMPMEDIILDHLDELAQQEDQLNRMNLENKVRALARGLSDLAKMMTSVQGRKHVLYLSEGFDSSLIRGTENQAEASAMAEAAARGAIWNAPSDKRFGSTSAANTVEGMLEALRRADCAIQAVDVGGLRAADGNTLGPRRASGRDTLFQMAKDTGGELYENFNDLGAAMDQMLTRTGVTYLLAFEPDKIKHDGSFHPLKVELRNAPRGARVVYRPGFYAPRPYAEQSPFEKLLQAANDVMGEESGTVATSVLAAPFSFGSDKAYVPVVIEVDGPSLLASQKAPALPAEIYVYALDSTGAIHDFFTQTVGLEVAKVERALRQSGLKFFGHVDLPPGDYSLRVLVRNGTTGQSGMRIAPVRVPAFGQAGAPAVLLPPFFPEPAGKWLLIRETPRGEKRDVPYPFMMKQQPYVPAALPVLAPEQIFQVRLVGYNLGAGDRQAATKVLAADGQEVEAGQLEGIEREASVSGQPDRLAATWRAPKLPPGEYRLVVTLTGASGTVEAGAPFAVGGTRG